MNKTLTNNFTVSNFKASNIEEIFLVRKLIAKQDKIKQCSTLEKIPTKKSVFESLKKNNSNPYKNVFVIKYNNKIVGYCQTGYWSEEGDIKLYIHHIFLLAQYRSKRLFQKLLDFNENHIRTIAVKHNSKNKFFGANASQSEKQKLLALKYNDYKIVWQMLEMELNQFDQLPILIIPKSFKIRPVVKDNFKAIYLANKKVYSGKWAAKPASDEEFAEFVNDYDNKNTAWTVAWNGSQVAGFVISNLRSEHLIIDEFSVLEEFRRQGLGKYLLVENIKQSQKKGIKKVVLHTDSKNQGNALSVYNKLGFTATKEHFRLRKPF